MSLKEHRRLLAKAGKQREIREQRDEAVGLLKKLEREFDAMLALHQHNHIVTIEPHVGSGTSKAVAVVLLSDWHVEELVEARQVNYVNRYNPDIARKRAEQCFQRIVRLVTKEQQDVEIGHLVVWLGGDFISGNIHEELLENCAMPPVDASMFAKELLGSGLKFLREHFKGKITCVCSSGNHGRITSHVHISTESGNSLETFIYAALRDQMPDIEWVIEPAYLTYLKVYSKVFRFNHGHFVRYAGGIGGLTIPLTKAIHGWDNVIRADFTALGHWHQLFSHRRFMVNGSLIGYNAFAVSLKCEYEPPAQAFFLWDNKRGRTITAPILFSV